MLWAYSVLYGAGLAVLLVATQKKKHYTLAKGFLSNLFVLGSVLFFVSGSATGGASYVLLLLALLLCAGGDIMLGIANRTPKLSKKPFLTGAVSFSVAHLLFGFLFVLFAPLRWFDGLPSLFLVGILLLLERGGKVRLRHMRPVALVYTFLVGFMTYKGVQAGMALGIAWPPGILLALGALLFLVSDGLLLFLYFGAKRHKRLRYANLSTYYIGVYLLAISAHWW